MSNYTAKQLITRIWIDESGDCGFKFDKGSSRFFVISVIYLVNENKIETSIDQLKLKLGLSRDYEFKFSRCKNKLKKEFFKIISKLPIQYKGIVVDKKKLEPPVLRFQPQQLYCELIRRLLYDNDPPLEKAILNIDEATAKIHYREFNAILKKYLSKNIVSEIRQKRSKNNIMIQIADMITGSIFRKYKKGDGQYYQMIKNKEKILIEF